MSNINKKALRSLLQASLQPFTARIEVLLVAVKKDGEIEVSCSPNEINEIEATLENKFKGRMNLCL